MSADVSFRQYFMEQLIDGDLASNNGGWQWSASTGVDPCPYFRIFNPYTQSKKVLDVIHFLLPVSLTRTQTDPTGAFIKHWLPELRQLNGPGKNFKQSCLTLLMFWPQTCIILLPRLQTS
jgi:deoxyribodipyrimidine photo-lyase